MKKLTAIALVLVMVLSMAGCGETEKAEETVTLLFEAFKAGDFDKKNDYLLKDSDEADDEDEMFNHVFTKIDYTIVSSKKISKDEVEVTAEITAPDMKIAVGEFFEKALEFAFANAFSENPLSEEETEKEMERIFIEATDREDLGTVTNEVVIKVVKTDDGWKVEADDAFADAVTGGMMTALSEMEQDMMNTAQ